MRFNYADDRIPYSMEYLGQTYYMLYNQIGSLRAVVDSNGLIVKRIDYDSFGNVILDSDPSFRIPIGFAGGLYDPDTGLVRFGLRDYDPSIGRWMAKDPIDFAGGDYNLYRYVGNSPVNVVDPYGLWRWPDYISLEINVAIPTPWTGTLIGWSGQVTLDRYGNLYWAPLGATIGKSATFVSGSLTVGWLNECGKPSEERIENFLSGHSINITAGYWGGGGITWVPGRGTATQVGFVTPQIGGSYHYSWQKGKLPLKW